MCWSLSTMNHSFQLSFSLLDAASYCISESWKDFAELLELKLRCTISTEMEKCDYQPDYVIQKPADMSEESDEAMKSCEIPNTSICFGNIAFDNADVIVNEVNANFNLSTGTISRFVEEHHLLSMQEECFGSSILTSPCLCVTLGKSLQCNYVIHLITPHTEEEVTSYVKEALEHAEVLEATSISFPAVGIGRTDSSLDADSVSMAMSKAFDMFLKNRPCTSIKKVKVFVSSHFSIDCFQKAMVKDHEDPVSFGKETLTLAEENATSPLRNDRVCIAITALNPLILQQAETKIRDHIKVKFVVRVILDEMVPKLDEHDYIDIYQAAVNFKVHVAFMTKASKIIMEGFIENVSKLYDYVREVLFELRESLTMLKLCAWNWTRSSYLFTALPLRVGREIERAYESWAGGTSSVKMYGSSCTIDFTAMTYEFNRISGLISRVVTSIDLKMPSDWVDMKGSTWIKISLSKNSQEYSQVYERFAAGEFFYSKVLDIERIQHPSLYKQYLIKKNDVERYMVQGHPVEQEQFHGTSKENIDHICCEGFDRNFAGKHGQVYGKGTYFATSSRISAKYCKESSPKAKRYMFLAKVLTGDYCAGEYSMQRPPVKTSSNGIPGLHDSVVDNVDKPSIYVVFKDASVYPYYLITYKIKGSAS